MSADTLQAYVSVAALLVALVGLPIVIVQLRELQRAVRSQAHAAIYNQAADFRSHLVAHPELRPYFFDGVEVEPGHADYQRVITIAELYLNYLEHIAVTVDSLGRPNRPSLERFVHHAFERGPVLRQRLHNSPAAYSDALHALARSFDSPSAG
jgi:hypothetical protein